MDYRIKHNIQVIYGPEFKIRETYPVGCLIFVAEMNNETNKIQGIGLINNFLASDKKYTIYENGLYNRYIYRGNYWISREDLIMLDSNIVEIFDNILFKGKSHMKFRSGITILTDKLFSHWTYKLQLLKNQVKTCFLKYFLKIKSNFEIEINNDLQTENEGEVIEIEITPKKKIKKNNVIKI